MSRPTRHREIDHRTLRLIVGVIAITLSALVSVFSTHSLPSVSDAYYDGGWPQAIFIGFLFAIGAFLFAYNGYTRTEMVLSKVAAVAAIAIAMFPCKCTGRDEIVPFVHGAAAVLMFVILAFFCHGFYYRAQAKGYTQARWRARVYAACGIAMLLAIGAMAYDVFTGRSLTALLPRFVFYGETAGLVAFGISWLTASRTLPGLTRSSERFSPLRDDNPGE